MCNSEVHRIGTRSGPKSAAFLMLLTGFCAATAAAAEKDEAVIGRFDAEYTVAFGGYFPYVDSTFSLNSSRGRSGTDLSQENDLGLDETNATPWLEFDWRFLPRHQLQVEWFQMDRTGSNSANRDFTVGDTTVSAGAALSSKADMNLGRITYGYSALRDEKLDLALMIGAHIATFKTTVTATGSLVIDGVPVANGQSTESSSTHTIPLPHIGTEFSYKISPRWTAQVTALAFVMEVDEFSGYLVQVDANATYQATKHFGLGAGLSYFTLELQAQNATSGAEFDYELFGPVVFAYVSF